MLTEIASTDSSSAIEVADLLFRRKAAALTFSFPLTLLPSLYHPLQLLD